MRLSGSVDFRRATTRLRGLSFTIREIAKGLGSAKSSVRSAELDPSTPQGSPTRLAG